MQNFRFGLPELPFYPSRYISHALLGISVIISILGFIFPALISYFGLHQIPLVVQTIPYVVGQLLLYQFLHGSMLHIFLNAYFLYSAGPEVESRMKKNEFIVFFLLNTVFVAIALWILSSGVTVGISGFCMALLAYLYMDMQAVRHPMANQILIMLVINVAFGFMPGISLVGHAAGAVFGIGWWMWKKG